jgi:predicted alpha-1,6-mannanase (GH76 family)
MRDWANQEAGSGRHRRRAAVTTSTIVIVAAVLAAAGVGYARSVTHDLARPAASAPLHIPSGPARFAAEASVAAGLLQRQADYAYLHTHLWQAASALTATIDYMSATGSRTYLGELSATYQAHLHGDGYRGHFYDDNGWWVLTWLNAYDLTGDPAYLAQAKSIFAMMAEGWTPACGGGVVWNQRRQYKNAITNEEFLQDAVLLHEATPGDTYYAGWAHREWAWFKASGMLTRSHLVIDGLTPRCRPRTHSPTWTYNQGTLIGGLVSLSAMTGHRSFLVTAEKVARAVMRSPTLSPGGILREPCNPADCGRDAPMFKGIFMLNLKLLYDRVGGAGYQRYMRRNALAVWADDRQGTAFGVSWGGPFRKPTLTSQASALDLLTTQIP